MGLGGLGDHMTLEPWDFGNMGIRDHGTPGLRDFGTMELFDHPLDFVDIRLWDHETLGPLNYRTMGLWDHLVLRPLDLELIQKITL